MADDITQEQQDDGGNKAHTPLDEPHPAGDGPRTDRDVGGPTAADDAPESDGGGVHGTKESPFEPHE